MTRWLVSALFVALGAPVVLADEVQHRVSIARSMPLRDAFVAVSDAAGMNLVVDPSATVSVGDLASVDVESATWKVALDALVQAHGLQADITGNVIRVVGPDDPCPGSGLAREPRDYRGRPLSLDFKDGVTIDILRFISEFAGLGIVLDPSATGLQTRSRLHLTEVPWDQALDLVLREACLAAVIENNVIRVSEAHHLTSRLDDGVPREPMRILLDPRFDPIVAKAIPGHEVVTAQAEGVEALSLDEIVAHAAAKGFQVVLSFAKTPPTRPMPLPPGVRLIFLDAASGRAEDVLPELSTVLSSIDHLDIAHANKPITVHRSPFMTVSYGDGRVEEKRIPQPDVVTEHTFDHVDRQVALLMASTARFASIIASTADGQRCISLHRRDGIAEFTEMVRWKQDPAREAAILEFFKHRQLEILKDYMAENGNMRVLAFRLPSEADAVAAVCRAAMVELHGISPDEPLLVTFQEDP